MRRPAALLTGVAVLLTLGTALPASADTGTTVLTDAPGSAPTGVFDLVGSDDVLLVDLSDLRSGPGLTESEPFDGAFAASVLDGLVVSTDGGFPTPLVTWRLPAEDRGGAEPAVGTFLTGTPRGWVEAVVEPGGVVLLEEVDVRGPSPVRSELGRPLTIPDLTQDQAEFRLAADSGEDALVVLPRLGEAGVVRAPGAATFSPLPDLPLSGYVEEVSVAGTAVSVSTRPGFGSTPEPEVGVARHELGQAGWRSWALPEDEAATELVTGVDGTLWFSGSDYSVGPAGAPGAGPVVAAPVPSSTTAGEGGDGRVLFLAEDGRSVQRRERLLTGTAQTLVTLPAGPLEVLAVDLTLGEVSWTDTSQAGDSPVFSRTLTTSGSGPVAGPTTVAVSPATGFSLARTGEFRSSFVPTAPFEEELRVVRTDGTTLTYAVTGEPGSLDFQPGDDTTASGRWLAPGRSLIDTRSGQLTSFPGQVAVSGDRVAWLGETGEVLTRPLSASGPVVTVAPGLSPDYFGHVAVAGDRVVWSRTVFTDTGLETEVAWRDVRTMAPATVLPGIAAGEAQQVTSLKASGRRLAVAVEDFSGPEISAVVEVHEFGQSAPQAVRDRVPFSALDLFGDLLAHQDLDRRLVAETLPSLVTTFDDTAGSSFAADVDFLVERGVTTGFVDESGTSTFRPTAPVSRQAMAAFLYRFAGSPAFAAPEVPTFADVPGTAPFFLEVEWLAATGVSEGSVDQGQRVFRPVQPVSREAMAAFLYRFAGQPAFTAPPQATFEDKLPGAPFFREVEWLASTGISTGTTAPDGRRTFLPGNPVSRQAMAAFLRRYDTELG